MTDRELDALIAENVMGWEIRWLGCEPHHYWEPDDGRGGRWNDRLPEYSTDIAAAFQVVEKMKRVRLWFSCCYQTGALRDDLSAMAWSCRFRGFKRGESIEGFHGDKSLPRAICLAALKAVGVNPEQA